MWSQALHGIRTHLLAYTQHTNLTILGELPQGLDGALFPKMDHLVCFLPGTIALAATGGHTLAHARSLPTWTPDHDAQMEIARELTKTCWGMYKISATGLSPEIAHFHLSDPVVLTASESTPRTSPAELSEDPAAEWRKDFDIHHGDLHNLQRPETVETLFYMWRITGDEKYREWGWEMFESFLKWTLLEETDMSHDDNAVTAVEKAKIRAETMRFEEGNVKKYRGFSSVKDVNQTPPPTKDNMESFWLVSNVPFFSSFLVLTAPIPLRCLRPFYQSIFCSFYPLRYPPHVSSPSCDIHPLRARPIQTKLAPLTRHLQQAETLKYFYLLFSPSDILPLTDIVLNTEAHPFPRFEMGKLFKTGWTRKPRDAEGRIIRREDAHEDKGDQGAVKQLVKDGKEGMLARPRDGQETAGTGHVAAEKKADVADGGVVPGADVKGSTL